MVAHVRAPLEQPAGPLIDCFLVMAFFIAHVMQFHTSNRFMHLEDFIKKAISRKRSSQPASLEGLFQRSPNMGTHSMSPTQKLSRCLKRAQIQVFGQCQQQYVLCGASPDNDTRSRTSSSAASEIVASCRDLSLSSAVLESPTRPSRNVGRRIEFPSPQRFSIRLDWSPKCKCRCINSLWSTFSLLFTSFK